jgi:putative ABC transport system permease protein
MFKNYFKTAWRNLLKNKIFSVINIIGLTIGLTSFLLIALYVFDELTFDSFHKNANNIYRLINDKTTADGKETKIAAAGYQVSARAKTDIPGVKDVVRITAFGRANVSAAENTNVFYEDFLIGNPGFLAVFDFKLLHGNRSTALTAPHSIIVTEKTAKKFFGTDDVLGKILKIDRDSIPYNITGVLKNFPANSSLSFNLMVSESSIADDDFKQFINSDWNSDYFTTCLLLDKNADPNKVASQINQLVASNQKKDVKDKSDFMLQPLKDVHFYSENIEGAPANAASIIYIYVFSAIALFILFIACINYMNLTTARFTNRTKEIAVRKVAGASRKNLIGQFLSEAFLLTAIALILALILTKILLPAFNSFTEKQLTLDGQTDYRIWVGVAIVFIVTALLSGIYPALFQSHLRPLLLLKNKLPAGKGNISLRRSLVVFQFTLSIIMIIATLVVYFQIEYVNTKDMGFKKDHLAVIDINSGKVRSSAETIKAEFLKLPQVKDVSVTSRVPGEWKRLPKVKTLLAGANKVDEKAMYFIGAGDAFLKTYQIALAKGRNFFAGSSADSASVLLNETAAKELHITNPSGQLVEIPSVNFGGGDFSPLDKPFAVRVIGIVKDFNFQSLHEPLAPMVIAYQQNPVQSIDYFTARLAPGNESATLKKMDAILHSIDQNHLFEYHFLDKQWDLFYRNDRIRETIFLVIAALAIFIACLGLFGLSTYAAEQRVKEIGIRKVLGATVSQLTGMLSKDFLKLVFVACIIAFPLAYWIMNKWLQSFAYRIHISWWIFTAAGFAAVLIALITVSFQAIKAAAANPVESLRSE